MNKVTEKIKELITIIKEFLEKLDKRIYAIVGIVFAIILIITIIVVPTSSEKERLELLELVYDTDKPIVFKNEDKYGYLTRNGEVLIEPKYDSAGSFYGNYALVSNKDDDTTKYEIIDRAGESIIQANSAAVPRYFKDYGVWLIDNKIYSREMEEIFKQDYHISYSSRGYFTYQDNNASSSGILDYKGKKVFSWNENYISLDVSSIDYPDATYYGVISNFEEKESILSLRNGRIIYTLEDPKNTYLEVEDDNIFRIIDRANNYKTSEWLYIEGDHIAFQTQDEIYEITIDNYKKSILKIDYGINYTRLGHDERYTYYDVKTGDYLDASYGKEESTTKNDWMESVYGYKTYTCSGLYGLMDKTQVLVDCTHTNITFLNDSLYKYLRLYHDKPLALVQKDSTYDIYNLKEQKSLVTFELASARLESESSFLLVTEYESDGFTKKDYVVRNLITDAQETFDASTKINLYSNYITVTKSGVVEYYDVDLNKIYETEK